MGTRLKEIKRIAETAGIPVQRSEADTVLRTKRSLRVAGALVKYSIYESADAPDGPLTLLGPGYVGCEEIYVPLAKSLARLKIRTATIEQARSQHGIGHKAQQILHPDLLLAQTLRGVARDIREKNGIESFNFNGQSKAGGGVISAVNYMVANGDRSMINSVNLDASAGMTDHNVGQMIARGPRLAREVTRNWDMLIGNPDMDARESALAAQALTCILRNIPRTFAEGIQVGGCNNKPGLEALVRNGIPVSASYYVSDPLFPAEAAERHIGSIVGRFSAMEDYPQAGHLADQFFPGPVAENFMAAYTALGVNPIAA